MDTRALLDSPACGRRSVLKGTTAVAGTLASLSAFGKLVAETFAQTPSLPVPEEARTPEAGLAAFVAKWQAAGPAIVLTRFGRFLSNRIFNCHVAGTPRAYNLFLGDRKSTRLNSSHDQISYAVFCLKKKKKKSNKHINQV